MIEAYGWSAALQQQFSSVISDPMLVPARVIAAHRDRWRVMTASGECSATCSGRFAFDAAPGAFPVTGDWVAVAPADAGAAVIHAVLPRARAFRRRAAGGNAVQVVAANIDVALLVAALNGDLNLRRLERYLVATRDADAEPVIVLTKADLCADVDAARAQVTAIAGDASVIAVAALAGGGLQALDPWLRPGRTVALLGSSGAGKSTLLNALAGADLAATGAIREDDARGRHTTTHRELFRLESGALVIDTPGMRELGLLADEDTLDSGFAEIADIASRCRFADCAHTGEPGCAVDAAIRSGALDAARLASFRKLQREIAYAERREDPAAAAAERQKWKRIHKAQRDRYRHRDRDD